MPSRIVTVTVSPRSGGEIREGSSEVTLLGTISVSGKCGWDLLDSLVQRLFKEYVMRVDPASNLGLNSDSILNYVVGEVSREAGGARPEYLPYGYLVGDTTSIALNLRRSVDSLAFETLTPKAVVKRYVSLLLEHKRIILSGPAGTGKTFMANRLAKYLAHCNNRDSNKTVGGSAASTPTTPTAGNFPSIADDSIMFFAVEADRDELYKKRSSRKIDSRILFSRE